LNNHTVYANEELASWTGRTGLLEQESYLIEKYLRNNGRLIEAGTGGGRIAVEIEKRFSRLNILAFDFVEEMIASAKKKSSTIDFRVMDASDLSSLKDESFDFAVYLQQIVSLVPEALIPKVLEEAYRILKMDGVVIFSFLYYEGRKINPLLSFMVNTVRFLRGEEREQQRLPWLKLGGKINLKLFCKGQATTYWFHENEIRGVLERSGFEILEVATSKQLQQSAAISEGMLYVVCRK